MITLWSAYTKKKKTVSKTFNSG